ncbi:MAG: GTPase [Isosphaeraceae bacterium]
MEFQVAVMTGSGRGAVAVVRVSGRDAATVADAVFRPARGVSLLETPVRRLRLGRAGTGRGDEVVAVRLDDGNQPVVELQCHGGPAAVESVVQALVEVGARRVEATVDLLPPGAGRIEAQAMADLALAPTVRSAEILLEQARGALRRELDEIRHLSGGGPERSARLAALAARGAVGSRLLSGWRIVIAGRPNVGKSRLFNALVGFDRSIVHPTPGVTRDVVAFRTAISGWPVELCDTAGQRETDDLIEGLGIDRARLESATADLVMLVLDRSQPLAPADRLLLAAPTTSPRLIVANKGDLPAAWFPIELENAGAGVLSVSAETGEGLEALIAVIGDRLVPDPPAPGAGAPFRREHLETLSLARERLDAGDLGGFERALEDLLGTARPR